MGGIHATALGFLASRHRQRNGVRISRTISASLIAALASTTFVVSPATAGATQTVITGSPAVATASASPDARATTVRHSRETTTVDGELIRAITEAPKPTTSGHKHGLGSADSHETAEELSGEQEGAGVTVHTLVDTGAQTVAVEDPQGLLSDVASGSEVSLAATTTAQLSPTSGASSSVVEVNAVTAAASATSKGSHQIYIALPTRSGAKAYLPPSATVAKDLVTKASDYWSSQTFGGVSGFKIAKTKGYTTSLSRSAICNIEDSNAVNRMWQEAAKKTGFTRGAGKHLIVFTEPCAYELPVGVAEVGSGLSSGGYITVNDATLSTLVHELGHNFSLGHSNLDVFEFGEIFEYEGFHSPMGGSLPQSWGTVPALDVAYQHRLGVLPSGQLKTLIGSQTVNLAPVDGTTGRRGALFYLPTTGKRVYAEYRSGGGFDSSALFKSRNFADMYDSLEVRFGPGVRLYTLEQQDYMTFNDVGTYTWEAKDNFFQTTVLPGESLAFPEAGFTVTVPKATSTFAEVKVSLAKGSSKVSAPKKSVAYGATPKLKVTTSSKAHLGGTVTAYYKDKVMGKIEVPAKRGSQTLTLPLKSILPMGKHTIKLKYSGSVSAKSSSSTTTVSVVKATPTVKVNVSNAYRHHTPKAVVTVSSHKVPAGKVTLWLDGKKLKTRSLTNGSVTFALPKYATSGTHKIKASYSGSSRFKAATKSTKFAVTKKRAKVSGFQTGTKSFTSAQSYSDKFTVNHTAKLQKRVDGAWKTVRTLKSGSHSLVVKTAADTGKYRIHISSSSLVVGVATESVTVKMK